jgi:DNA-binding SARP family transcriptional activator/class 3 adenylate cyclase/tetratricopeptide (TPR) repeat protein
MEFRTLGELEVWDEGKPVPLRGSIQRSVLAYLLLHANELVPVHQVVDELWGVAPPPTAAKMVQNAVSGLRKLDGFAETLLTRTGGYVLQLEHEQLDSRRFEQLVEQAREALAAGAPDVAAHHLERASALWRGPPFAGVPSVSFAQLEIARLEELRLESIECGIGAGLALGRHNELAAELESLVAQHPLRETLRLQQMLALYRSGRQAEALAAYQAARTYLGEELGIDPSPALQRLERSILLQDPELEPVLVEPPLLEPALVEPPLQEPAGVAAHALRKTLTVLHVELGRTHGRLDPEALRGVTATVESRLVRVIEEHGGAATVAPGGAMLAVFGVPSVGEDDPLRALRAAAEARAAVEELNGQLEADWGVRISVRAGVGTGEAIVDPFDTSATSATGDVFAVAAHLAHAAADGDVLVSETTRSMVKEGVQAEPAAEVEVAGEAQRPWRLTAVGADATVFPRHLDAPLVGREWELAQLRHGLDRALRGRTSFLVTVLGAAGIGKSRLAQELADSLGESATVLLGRCVSHGAGATFSPLAELIRDAAGATSPDAIAALLEGEQDAGQIAQRIAGAIGSAEPAGSAAELFWAVRKLFAVIAGARPLVIVVEDIHWAEPTLLDLLEHLVEATREAPILLLCLARSELLDVRPTWGGGKMNSSALLLEPLSPAESELVVGHAGGSELGEAVAARIAEAAEGNPLFIEQMVAMALEAGSEATDVTVPPTIQALLAARLDRLGALERGVLERASVVGREFWRDAVVHLSPVEERDTVDQRLDALARRELIGAVSDGYRFRHGLIREAAYDALPKAERAALHEQFARYLEQASEREQDEIVGFHLEQAYRCRAAVGDVDQGLAARAAELLAAAGRRAYARDDIPAAVALLARAVDLYTPQDRTRLELLADLGEAVRESGDYVRAEQLLGDAIDSAHAVGERAREEYARLVRLRMRVQTDPALGTDDLLAGGKRAIAFFGELGDDHSLGKAWELVAWGRWLQCRAAETETALHRSLEHARKAGDSRTAAQSLHLLLGATLFGPMRVPEAIARCQGILEDEHQKRVTASALRALAALKAMAGDFRESRALLRRFAAIVDDLGLRVTAASAAETYAFVELLAGEPRAAERELRLGYERLEEMGETSTSANLAALLAQALHAQGRDAEAVAVTELTPGTHDVSAQVHLRAVRAKALGRVGRVDEAEELGRDAVARARESDFVVMCGDALCDLADVLEQAGRADEALPLLDEAVQLYDTKGNIVAAERARHARDALEV